MNIAKRITVAGLLVFVFLLVSLSMHDNLVGMATSEITYKCTDNDAFGDGDPINSRGIVIVTSSAGERWVYTDDCVDDNTILEYSCNPNTNKEFLSEESCMYDQVCRFGHCTESRLVPN